MRSGPDLNGDNLRISRAYLRISDLCGVRVRIYRLGFGIGLGLRMVVYKLLDKVTKCYFIVFIALILSIAL